MFDPLPFLKFHPLGMDCLGYPFLVNGKGRRAARDCVQEKRFQVFHVYSGSLGFYLWFVTPDVVRKALGGWSARKKVDVYITRVYTFVLLRV